MKKLILFAGCIVLFLCACKSKQAEPTAQEILAAKPFDRDSSHKPYKYSRVLIGGENKLVLAGKHKAGLPVGILDFEKGKVIAGKTTNSFLLEDDFEGNMQVTDTDAKPEEGRLYDLAVLDYSGQPFSLVPGDTLTDQTLSDSIIRLVVQSKALEKVIITGSANRPVDKPLMAATVAVRPAVVALGIPGMKAYMVAWIGDQEKSATPSVIVIDGKVYPVAGPCTFPDIIFKLGQNYFIASHSMFCRTDEDSEYIQEITRQGLKVEAILK
ncbi:MAG: hypothetical protein EOO05_17075 [Chitinophagaceae bacterium]|nr:MAG: hypothetical protein EOO05_17075 [Chitinophagaceae bacterium]